MKLPQTPVDPGHEQDALREHVRKVTNFAVHSQLQKLVGEFEQEERAKRKLAGVFAVAIAVVCGIAIVVLLILYGGR